MNLSTVSAIGFTLRPFALEDFERQKGSGWDEEGQAFADRLKYFRNAFYMGVTMVALSALALLFSQSAPLSEQHRHWSFQMIGWLLVCLAAVELHDAVPRVNDVYRSIVIV